MFLASSSVRQATIVGKLVLSELYPRFRRGFEMRFTLRQLECLVAIGAAGSIAGAAKNLSLSASAVTGSLNELEKIFNTQLTIRRKAHGVQLTPAGSYVLSQARNLIEGAEDLELMASGVGEVLRGRVKIGCYSSLAPTVLTELLDVYGQLHPQVQLDFYAGTQQRINEMLLAGELDLALVYDFSLDAGLERTKLFSTEPSLVLPAGHALAGEQKVALAELVAEPMILLDVPPSREHTEMVFKAAGLTPWIRYRTTDFEVTRSMVGRGMGYAILVQRPASDLTYEGRRLVTKRIHPAVRRVGVSMVYGAGVRLSLAAVAMRDLAVQIHAL
ncbi:LysR family transcriptional regulator [Arthrobacter sp. MYb224]|nr:LysR family transcriptional regulator [Arthrobacter sp. MYb224]